MKCFQVPSVAAPQVDIFIQMSFYNNFSQDALVLDEQHVLARYNVGLIYLQQHQLHQVVFFYDRKKCGSLAIDSQALEAFTQAMADMREATGSDDDDSLCANLGVTLVGFSIQNLWLCA